MEQSKIIDTLETYQGIVLRKTGWLVLEAFNGYLIEENGVPYLISFPP